MRKSRFTDEQIIGFIKQADAGMSVADLCRREGFSSATFYMYGLPVECNGLAARPMS
jgi:putative transposase